MILKKSLLTVGIGAALLSSVAMTTYADDKDKVSPVFNVEHKKDRHKNKKYSKPRKNKIRTIDGSNNNLRDPQMGAILTQLVRVLPSDYSDGLSALAGTNRPSPRDISNVVVAQSESIPNPLGASDYLWQWGQFLDHDIDLTEGADPAEPANITVPADDIFFNPGGTISFNRSLFDENTGITTPREQLNEISAWIDASNVYGSEEERAEALRTHDGSGTLKTSAGNLLPFNVDGLPNAGGDSSSLFLAGDIRANEQVGLAVMHTLFVREHNRLAKKIAHKHPNWNGDKIYEKARQIVGAQMQVITYKEFLPALLGPNAIRPYKGYKPRTNAGIANSFSTAAYRFGHSALSPTLLRLDRDGNPIAEGNLALRDAFFNPSRIINEGGIDPVLRGLAAQEAQQVDPLVIDDVRNFLFGAPPADGFDLPALNIQRGRDHGLPSYNAARAELGLAAVTQFSDITSDPDLQTRLAQVYGDVDNIDLWIGGLSEDPLAGGHLGELFVTIIADQFEALRDGDRFWYTRTLSQKEIKEVESTTLADIIVRNSDVRRKEIPSNVFFVNSLDDRGDRRSKRRPVR